MKHEKLISLLSDVVSHFEDVRVLSQIVEQDGNVSVARLELTYSTDEDKWHVEIQPTPPYSNGEAMCEMILIQVQNSSPVPVPALAGLIATLLEHGF